jgi:hypothetical protein
MHLLPSTSSLAYSSYFEKWKEANDIALLSVSTKFMLGSL